MSLIQSKTYRSTLEKLDFGDLQGKTIVITGATGMIGSCMIDALAVFNRMHTSPCRIIAVSRKRESAKQRFLYCWDEPYFMHIEQDVCDEPHGWPEHVDYVIHAASNADPVSFAKSPVDTLLANVVGTDNLLKSGMEHGMTRFMYVSSGEMYGQPDAQQNDFVEDYCGPVNHGIARSCYPAGKRAAEVLCQSYISQYGVDAVVVRPCHIFGPTMTSSDSRAVSEFLRNAALGKDIGMKSAGLVERSHCYVIDAVNAMLKVLLYGECGQAYNIADPVCKMTIRDFAMLAAEAGGTRVVFENPSDLEVKGYARIARQVLSAEKLMGIGWKGQLECSDAIRQTVEILREVNEVNKR